MSGAPRLVFDTNTLISHLLLPSSLPAQAVRKGLHQGQILVSDETLCELADVLVRPKFDRYISIEERQEFFRVFGRVAEKVHVIRSIQACRDPKDNKFLELAIDGLAACIITGDHDLLTLHPFYAIEIITPQDYLAGG